MYKSILVLLVLFSFKVSVKAAGASEQNSEQPVKPNCVQDYEPAAYGQQVIYKIEGTSERIVAYDTNTREEAILAIAKLVAEGQCNTQSLLQFDK